MASRSHCFIVYVDISLGFACITPHSVQEKTPILENGVIYKLRGNNILNYRE